MMDVGEKDVESPDSNYPSFSLYVLLKNEFELLKNDFDLSNGPGPMSQLMPSRFWFIPKVTQTRLLSHERTSKSSIRLSSLMTQS